MSPMAIGRIFKIAIELGVCRPDRGSIQSVPERIFAVSIYACYSDALNLPSMIELPQLRFQQWSSVWHQGYRKMPAEQADTDSEDRSHGKVLRHALRAAKQCHREPHGLVFSSACARRLEPLSFGFCQVNVTRISVLLAGSGTPLEVRTR